MSLLSFYRKLDLYKRIYALNYAADYYYLGDMSGRINHMSALTTDLNAKKRYLNISDFHLALATLSKPWIDKIFTKALVDILATDKTIMLKAKCLKVLSAGLPAEKVKYIIAHAHKNINSKIPALILTYDLSVAAVINLLQSAFFFNSHALIGEYMARRLDMAQIINLFEDTQEWQDLCLARNKLSTSLTMQDKIIMMRTLFEQLIDILLLDQAIYKAAQKIVPMTMRIVANEYSKV